MMNRIIYRMFRLSHGLRRWFLQRLTPAGLCVLVALCVFGMIGLDIKRSVSYQMVPLLFALLLVAVVLSRFSRYRVSATRHLPRFATVGVPLRYRVVLRNLARRQQRGLALTESFANTFPTLAEFRRVLYDKAGKQAWVRLMTIRQQAVVETVQIPPLSAKGEAEVTTSLIPLRRGLLKFNQLMVACPDPLNLVNRCRFLSMPQTVLVLPRRYQLPPISLPGSRRDQANGLQLASSVGDAEEFRSLREYRPGDSPKKIHWKSWAKTGKPIVKEEQAEYSVRHALILDTFLDQAESELLEEAVAIAASFAYTIQTQESLLDMVFVAEQAHCFTVGRGLGQTERLLELLASVVPCADSPFRSLLPLVQSRLSLLSGCICILLGWDSDRQALVEQLQSAGVPTLVIIVADKNGITPPPDPSCLKEKQSRLRVLHVGKIQEELWAL